MALTKQEIRHRWEADRRALEGQSRALGDLAAQAREGAKLRDAVVRAAGGLCKDALRGQRLARLILDAEDLETALENHPLIREIAEQLLDSGGLGRCPLELHPASCQCAIHLQARRVPSLAVFEAEVGFVEDEGEEGGDDGE